MAKDKTRQGKYPEPYTRGRAIPHGSGVGRLGNDNKYHVDGGIQEDAYWSQGIGKTMKEKPQQ